VIGIEVGSVDLPHWYQPMNPAADSAAPSRSNPITFNERRVHEPLG
jgi:hypothetical protein